MARVFKTGITSDGDIAASGKLQSTASSGDEGGEIFLKKAATNTTIDTGVTIDVYQNKLRFFEQGGSARGYYIDLTSGGAGVSTSLTGGTTGAMNYATQESTKQSSISASGVTIVSKSFTTNGYPVQVLVTGDAENSTAGAWVKLQLYRDSTPIGKIVHVEMSAASENVPYALTVIDAPAAGTYTYALKTVSVVSTGTMNFGETDGPVLTLVELSGPKGDTGATGTVVGNALTIKADSGTTEGTDLYTFTGASAKTINFVSGTNLTIAETAGTLTFNATDTNTYPTTWAWTAGGAAGPTASITGTSSTISVAAVPSASATASGVVTTGTQTFAGAKTFNSTISGSIDGNAATATTATSATTATNANNINISTTDGNTSDTTMYPVLVAANTTGNQLPHTDVSGLSYNASTNALTATTFSGALSGNATTATSAGKWTSAVNLAGNSVDGSGNVAFSNKFIVQGTTDAGLSGAQFLGALATGIVKNTTTTGVLSIAVAGTDYVVPSGNITGTAAKADDLTGGNSTTLLGSIPYQSNTDTTTLLSPNTTTTKKFLRQTGTGTNGAAPAWDTLVNGDIPTALSGKTYEGITLSGTAATTMTFPTTDATIARTDAAQTFTGTQTFSGQVTANGNVGSSAGTALTVYTGNYSSGTSPTSNIIMRSGNVSSTGTGASGNVTVTTGTTAAAASGATTLSSGAAIGGASGNVSIISGTTTTSGNSGDIRIQVGTAAGTAGSISIGTGTITNTTSASSITIGGAATSTITLTVSSQINVSGSINHSSGNYSTAGSITRTALAGGGSTTATFDNSGNLVRTTSSARYKEDIAPAEYLYEDILSLEPKTFRLKSETVDDENARTYAGFIAEDLDQIDSLKVFVNYLPQEDGTKIPDGINYGEMVSALVSAIKHQDQLIKTLTDRVAALEA